MTLKTNVLVWLDENILKTSEMFARSDEQRILKEKLSFKWYDKLKLQLRNTFLLIEKRDEMYGSVINKFNR